MTDLEKLAAETVRKMNSAPFFMQQAHIEAAIEIAYKRGRIEGLKEAEAMAEDAAEASRLLRQLGEISSLAARIDCGERADAVDARLEAYRTRIQELERAASGLPKKS